MDSPVPSDNDTIVLSMDDSSSMSCTSPEPDIESLTDGKSEHFNPLIALYLEETASLKSEIAAEAPAYLHVFELEKAVPNPKEVPVKESSIKRKTAKPNAQKATEQKSVPGSKTPVAGPSSSEDTKESTTSGESKAEPYYPIPGRKFLPHQLPVYRPRKEHPNVITSMETVEGPLAVLRDVMKTKRRVKVWTRNNTGIRGFCVGNIFGFDSHWNIAMGNVEEYFQRRRVVAKTTSQSAAVKTEAYRKPALLAPVDMKEVGDTILIDSKDALATIRAFMKFNTALTSSACRNTRTEPVFPVQESQAVSSGTSLVSKSQIRKKGLVILRQPEKDVFGYDILARSQHYEIVYRRQKNLFLLGNDIAFVESKPA